jgi:hypothetical protein
MPVVHDENDEKAVEASQPYLPGVEGTLNFGKGLGVGAAKGVAGMIPASVEGQSWKDWAASEGDPTSMAERAGEWTGDVAANVAPFFVAPELGIAAKAGELANMAALGARTAGRIGQGAYKAATTVAPRVARFIGGSATGAATGAAEAALHNEEQKDPNKFTDATKRGAVTGGVTATEFMAGRLAYEALPPAVKHLIQMGAMATTVGGAGLAVFDRLGHHHWIPYHLLYGLAAPAVATVGATTKLPPAVVGAGAERISQGLAYEPTDPKPQRPDEGDTIEQPR